MLEALITSKTRMQLLLHFFLNPDHSSYLRKVAKELGESTNGIRIELNRLEEAKLLTSSVRGRQKWYKANNNHPLFPDLISIVKKVIGFDIVVDQILVKLGHIQIALVVGDYAKGIDSGTIDLIIVGEVDNEYLNLLVKKTEQTLKRSLRLRVMSIDEYQQYQKTIKNEDVLIIWRED